MVTTSSLLTSGTALVTGSSRSFGTSSPLSVDRSASLRQSIANGWIVGLVGGDGTALDDAYKVSIFSMKGNNGQGVRVVGAIQNSINYKVDSQWIPLIPLMESNLLYQATAALRFSPQTAAMSRRVWKGTSPLTMQLELRFESITDSKINVMKPCAELMKMALPTKVMAVGTLTTFGHETPFAVGVLAPPGPYPYMVGRLNSNITTRPELGDRISIFVGSYANFQNVIVKEVIVDFDTRIGSDGFPISAKVNVIFETYEIWTKETVDFQLGLSSTVAPSLQTADVGNIPVTENLGLDEAVKFWKKQLGA